eukprot:6665566-Prorocentrum_lima.AAC.1
MSDPGKPYAMWDTGASPFLLPLTRMQQGLAWAVVRLAVGDTNATYWKFSVRDAEHLWYRPIG